MENNLSNKISNVAKNSINTDEDVVLIIKDVFDRSEPSNEGVASDVDLGNMCLLNENIMLNYLCLPKEALIYEENVQLLEEVIMKDNDKFLICVIDLSDNMVDHIVHQMQFELKFSKIEDVGCHPKFLAKLMKDDTNDKEDVSDILSAIVVTMSPIQKKDKL